MVAQAKGTTEIKRVNLQGKPFKESVSHSAKEREAANSKVLFLEAWVPPPPPLSEDSR